MEEAVFDFDQKLISIPCLEHLVEFHLDGAAKGIAEQIIRQGDASNLSKKQSEVFRKYVAEEWFGKSCERCSHEIEPENYIGFWGNGSFCYSCAYQESKDS